MLLFLNWHLDDGKRCVRRIRLFLEVDLKDLVSLGSRRRVEARNNSCWRYNIPLRNGRRDPTTENSLLHKRFQTDLLTSGT